MTLYIDPQFDGDQIRERLFAGDLIVLTRLTAIDRFVEHTTQQLRELFAPHDPEHIAEHITPEELAVLLGTWKPDFIHSPKSRDLLKDVVLEAGFPAEHTHYDLPKPRTSMPKGHLNSGVAFAFPWHRDAWYSAPKQQVNFWFPIFAARPDNAMSFDLSKFGKPVENDSRLFDYYGNNAARHSTAAQVGREVQARPGAGGHRAVDELCVLPPPGGVLLFSGAQLHTSIPNTSGLARFSVDFRTVDVRDVLQDRGAPVVDADCTGTSIRDFVSLRDDAPFDEAMVRELFGSPPDDVMLVFEPEAAGAE